MVQPNVGKRPKPKPGNGPTPGMGNPLPIPQVQPIMAVVVPVEIYEQMKRAVRAQPFEDVELLMQTMRNLVPQQVNMGPPPG